MDWIVSGFRSRGMGDMSTGEGGKIVRFTSNQLHVKAWSWTWVEMMLLLLLVLVPVQVLMNLPTQRAQTCK